MRILSDDTDVVDFLIGCHCMVFELVHLEIQAVRKVSRAGIALNSALISAHYANFIFRTLKVAKI